MNEDESEMERKKGVESEVERNNGVESEMERTRETRIEAEELNSIDQKSSDPNRV